MTTGDENSKENEKKAFVKWRSLPYEDATWETIDLVPKDKLDLYKKYNTLDQLKVVICCFFVLFSPFLIKFATPAGSLALSLS